MESAILHTESNHDLKLLLQLAKKLGISTLKSSKEEIENISLSAAITS